MLENNDIHSDETTNEGDLGKTQVMDSVQLPKLSGEQRGITPKNEFIDMNSSDDMTKTMRMDSITDEDDDKPEPISNPVKKRRRRKKQTNHTRTMGQIFLGAVISVGAICAGSVLAVNVVQGLRDITGMAKDYKEYDIVITESMGVDEIVDMLHSHGMIIKSDFFKTYLKHQQKKEDAKPILPLLISESCLRKISCAVQRILKSIIHQKSITMILKRVFLTIPTDFMHLRVIFFLIPMISI